MTVRHYMRDVTSFYHPEIMHGTLSLPNPKIVHLYFEKNLPTKIPGYRPACFASSAPILDGATYNYTGALLSEVS